MKRKVIAMIGIAAVFGALSIFAADLWLRSQASARVEPPRVVVEPAAPRVEFSTIVVAAAPLRFGMQIEASHLSEIAWPAGALPEGAFASAAELMAQGGRVVLSPIEPNEPVLAAKLSGAGGRATLSNLLSPGMRAVTIRTDEVAGVGGFVTPGDRVDVVLTRDAGAITEVSGVARGAAGSTIATEIVVADVRVLTVGQAADERSTGPRVVGSITLEVTAEGAQKVALARNVGTLSLSLRSAGEHGEGPEGVTTLSTFGGTVGSGLTGLAGELAGRAAEPEETRFSTVFVRRGTGEPQSYQVVSPGE